MELTDSDKHSSLLHYVMIFTVVKRFEAHAPERSGGVDIPFFKLVHFLPELLGPRNLTSAKVTKLFFASPLILRESGLIVCKPRPVQ